MKTPSPAVIAIDLDGTMIDSVADLHMATTRMQHDLGHSPSSRDDVRGWVGNGIDRLVHRALTKSMELDAPATIFAQGLTSFRTAYQQVNGQYSAVYPDVIETLRSVKAAGIPIACVTNKARAFTSPLLEAHDLSGFFRCVVAGDDVEQKKPHPEALLVVAEKINATPADCMMVGDSISDVKAAEAAGFSFIGVSYGYNHGQSLHDLVTPANHRAIIDNFADLLLHL